MLRRNPPKLQSSFAQTSEDTRIPPRSGDRGFLRRRVNRIFLTLKSAYPLMIRQLTGLKEERKTFHAGLIFFCTLRIQQLKRPLHF